jgi:hypothetical protein
MKDGFSLISNLSVKEQTDRGLMDGPGTYGRLPWKGNSKDASDTGAEDTISIGSGDRVSGADRMGMEVHSYFSEPAFFHIIISTEIIPMIRQIMAHACIYR